MRTPHTTTFKRLFSSWRSALLTSALAFAATAPALASPFAVTYTGTVEVSTNIPEFTPGDPYTITYVLDNGGTTAVNQMWMGPQQLLCVIVRNSNNTAAFAWNAAVSPTSSNASKALAAIGTDANGAVTSGMPLQRIYGNAVAGRADWSTISLSGFGAAPQQVAWNVPWPNASYDPVLGFDRTQTALFEANGDLGMLMQDSSNWSDAKPFGGNCLTPLQSQNPDPIDLTLNKTLTSTGPYTPGSTATFKLLASNLGPGTAQPAIVVTDTLPAGLEFVSATGTDWTCSAVGQVVTCTRSGTAPALAKDDAASPITLVTRVAANASGTLSSVAYVAPAANETLVESNLANGYDDGNPATLSNNDASAALKVTLPPTPVPTLGHGALGLLSLLTLLSARRRRSV